MAEALLYEPVLIELKRLFESVGVTASLEITATTGARDKVAQAIVPGHDILFAFLNGNRPDILGVDDKRRWIVAEIKDGGIGLEEVYQAKKYKELFSAPFGFLVSATRIPTRLRRLCEVRPAILRSSDDYRAFLVLAQFDPDGRNFVDWFPDNPFNQPAYYFD
jgi:hypothetical protein